MVVPFNSTIQIPPVDPLAQAEQQVRSAAVTFLGLAIDARNVTQILALHEEIGECIRTLAQVEESILRRADDMCHWKLEPGLHPPEATA